MNPPSSDDDNSYIDSFEPSSDAEIIEVSDDSRPSDYDSDSDDGEPSSQKRARTILETPPRIAERVRELLVVPPASTEGSTVQSDDDTEETSTTPSGDIREYPLCKHTCVTCGYARYAINCIVAVNAGRCTQCTKPWLCTDLHN